VGLSRGGEGACQAQRPWRSWAGVLFFVCFVFQVFKVRKVQTCTENWSFRQTEINGCLKMFGVSLICATLSSREIRTWRHTKEQSDEIHNKIMISLCKISFLHYSFPSRTEWWNCWDSRAGTSFGWCSTTRSSCSRLIFGWCSCTSRSSCLCQFF